jgi:hypothetical protein
LVVDLFRELKREEGEGKKKKVNGVLMAER